MAGVPIFSLYIPIIIARILNEEKVLARDLPGYAEYRREYGIACCPEFGEASSGGSGFAIEESNGVANG
jgi:hypothetical protein